MAEGYTVCSAKHLHCLVSFNTKFYMKFYFSNLREDFAALCTDFEPFGAQQVVIYNLNDLTLIRSFSGHNCGVLQVVSFGNIFVTRDKEGIIIIWDANNACDENKEVSL